MSIVVVVPCTSRLPSITTLDSKVTSSSNVLEPLTVVPISSVNVASPEAKEAPPVRLPPDVFIVTLVISPAPVSTTAPFQYKEPPTLYKRSVVVDGAEP